jgi:hypothetical protein
MKVIAASPSPGLSRLKILLGDAGIVFAVNPAPIIERCRALESENGNASVLLRHMMRLWHRISTTIQIAVRYPSADPHCWYWTGSRDRPLLTMRYIMRYVIVMVLAVFQLVNSSSASAAGATAAAYFGLDAVIVVPTGCNASNNVQVPGTTNLFVGRQFFKQNGALTTAEEKCGADEDIREAVRSNRWGIVLSQLNWQNKQFSIIKALIGEITVISGGPIRGARMKVSDPDIVSYRGEYLMTFECLILNGGSYKIDGTSACIAPYEPASQQVRLDRAYVVVSGKHTGPEFHSASVPQLLVFRGSLFLYWSALTVNQGKPTRDAVRGVQLEADNGGFYWARGVGHMIYSIDPPSVEVWGPDPGNAMSDTAVDIKSVWVHGSDVIALAGLGGRGCAAPGPQPGCFRMAITKASQPLGDHIFNKSALLHEPELPTNPQGYTRPIRNPAGGYSFIGLFFKPSQNGYSETRPVPADWSKPGTAEIVIFPFPDRNLWPTE